MDFELWAARGLCSRDPKHCRPASGTGSLGSCRSCSRGPLSMDLWAPLPSGSGIRTIGPNVDFNSRWRGVICPPGASRRLPRRRTGPGGEWIHTGTAGGVFGEFHSFYRNGARDSIKKGPLCWGSLRGWAPANKPARSANRAYLYVWQQN